MVRDRGIFLEGGLLAEVVSRADIAHVKFSSLGFQVLTSDQRSETVVVVPLSQRSQFVEESTGSASWLDVAMLQTPEALITSYRVSGMVPERKTSLGKCCGEPPRLSSALHLVLKKILRSSLHLESART